MKYISGILRVIVATAVLVFVLTAASINANSSGSGFVNEELQRIRYNYALALSESSEEQDPFEALATGDQFIKRQGKKSPTKAFLLSLAVPGLGQYYYGSKVKPIAFIGVEAAAWLLHADWHGNGEDLTVEFEQFNRDHWYQARYEDYLNRVYGESDDELITAQEVSHHLPDTRTQQYYEMTGKYDQFSWGWDDAIFDDSVTFEDWDSIPPQAVTGPAMAPASARRIQYEIMRDNANNKFNKASNMLMVVMANHIVSAVEAFLTTKSKNNASSANGSFSRLKIRPSMRSIYSRSDTPYVRLSYRF